MVAPTLVPLDAPAECPAGVFRETDHMTFTKPQFAALWAAFKKNGGLHAPGGRMGGSKRRMCQRLAGLDLLENRPPFPITDKGLEELRQACHRRWARSGVMAHLDDLREVEQRIADKKIEEENED